MTDRMLAAMFWLVVPAVVVIASCNGKPIDVKATSEYDMVCTDDLTGHTPRFTRRCENKEVVCYGDGNGITCHWKPEAK